MAQSFQQVDIQQSYDVVIVGFGPVGQTLAGLLGARGHRVGVFERHLDIYPLPRAVRLDGEVMRILQEFDLVDEVEHELFAVDNYRWFGADGEIILDINSPDPHPSGWAQSYVFHQPTVERALSEHAKRQPTVSVNLGWEVDGLSQTDAGATVTLRPADQAAGESVQVDCRFLVGADGANSVVRGGAGIEWDDLGFEEPWLVVDFRPNDMDDFADLPAASQFCNPSRPTTVARNGNNLRRWEFMLVGGEQPGDYATEEQVWSLLGQWAQPDQGTIERHAVYTFRSLVAASMSRGSVFLAGDAAHLMPPFLGEGMCTGIRDGANLAWKLDLVLNGLADQALLDSYHAERYPQNRQTIEASLFMGQVSCTLDPNEAAGRDAAFRAGEVPPPPPPPPLQGGVTRDAESDPMAGTKAVQGVGLLDGATVRTDAITGRGLRLVVADGAAAGLDHLDRSALGSIELATIDLADPATDTDGSMAAWLDQHGRVATVVRPDHYVFASIASYDELPDLLSGLGQALAANS